MGQNFPNIQTVFNRGELSPRLIGRVDNENYYHAYYYGQNMIPYPQGSTVKRPGTYYVATAKSGTDNTVIVPFRFSTVQNYVIEMGDLYFRVYRNRGRVETSPGTAYEVVTPYPASVLRQLKFVQSADTLYVFHPSYQTRSFTRTADASWSVNTLTFTDGPYLNQNATATTLALSGTSGSVTVTASATTGINGGTGFVAGDVGRQIRINNSTTIWSTILITAFTDSTHVTGTITGTVAVTATKNWRLGYFGGTNGWPSCGTFYEQRLILGNLTGYPSTVFGSVSGDFLNFAPSDPATGTVTDSNGFVVTISDDQVNAVTGFSSGRVLIVLTTGAAYLMTGGTSSTYAAITPSNVTIRRQSNQSGAATYVRAQRINNNVLYFSPSGLKLRELGYEYVTDSYVASDATIFNDQITKSGIIDCDFQSEPDPNIWCVRTDGQLVSFLYNQEQKIEGWHRHILGGTNTVVKAVACIPRPDLSGDDVWLVVQRTVNGATVQFVEYMTQYFDATLGQKTAFFVDAGLTYNGAQAVTLTLSATTGSVTATAGSATFSAGNVGQQIRAGGGHGTITAYTDSTHVTILIDKTPSGTSFASGAWTIAIKVVTGLTHLEGQTVSILADGAVVPTATVSSGGFTLTSFAGYITAGLGYINYLILLPLEIKQLGTIQGRMRTPYRIHVYVTDSLLLNYGALGINGELDLIPSTQLDISQFDVAPPLVSGVVTLSPPAGYDQTGMLVLQQNSPTPLTLNYVVQEISVGG